MEACVPLPKRREIPKRGKLTKEEENPCTCTYRAKWKREEAEQAEEEGGKEERREEEEEEFMSA